MIIDTNKIKNNKAKTPQLINEWVGTDGTKMFTLLVNKNKQGLWACTFTDETGNLFKAAFTDGFVKEATSKDGRIYHKVNLTEKALYENIYE